MKKDFKRALDKMSTEEKLFFNIMRMPHVIKRNMVEGQGHEGPGHGPEHGPGPICGHGGPEHGPGPKCGHGGPEGPGPKCGHGPHGHGHGPHGPGRGMHHHKMKAFAQARLLSALMEHEDGVRQKVLAEEMRVNPSSMSELIGKLEAEGYAVRTVDPEDKRATLITLTEVGKARAYELEDERQERFAKPFAKLTEDEKEQLLSLLEKLVEEDEPEEE